MEVKKGDKVLLPVEIAELGGIEKDRVCVLVGVGMDQYQVWLDRDWVERHAWEVQPDAVSG